MMQVLVAIMPANGIMLQITQDNMALAHVYLDAAGARTIADSLIDCAKLLELANAPK